jgi:hypothetical protein
MCTVVASDAVRAVRRLVRPTLKETRKTAGQSDA